MPNDPTQIAIAVVEQNGRFLVGERPAGKPLAGYAEFPGGRVEEGETPAQAAIRECLEETGLQVRIVDSYDTRQHEYSHDTVNLHFFACLIEGALTEPKRAFRWVTPAELSRLKFPEANRALLSQLLEQRDL